MSTPHATHHRARLPLVLAAVAVVMTSVGVLLMLLNGRSVLGSFAPDLIVVGTVYAVVGGLVASRVPENRVGWVLLVAALLWSIDLLVSQVAWYGMVVAPGSVPFVGIAVWLSAWVWVPGTALLLFALPMLFPTGHLLSPRWRPVAAFGVVATVLAIAGHALVVWPIRDEVTSLSPTFDASAAPGLGGLLASLGDAASMAVLPFLGAIALVLRYRRSRGPERLQARWLAYAMIAMVPCILVDGVFSGIVPALVGVASAIGLTLIAVAFAVAILRYKLYAIDRIVSRTIGWALVTGSLALVFAGAILVLGDLLAPITGGSTLGVAISTLLVAALFQPLRGRVQAAVDRRFDRKRYDAQQTATAFARTLRDDVDLDSVGTELREVVGRTVAPVFLGVWLRDDVR